MNEYITFTYFDTDKNQEMTIKCDATSLCQNLPSYKGKKLNEQHVVQQMTTVFKLTDLPNALRVHGKSILGVFGRKRQKCRKSGSIVPRK